MAQLLTNCLIRIDAEEFSGKNTAVAISMSAEAEQIREMGDTTIQRISDGLVDWSMAMEFNADESQTGRFFALVGKAVPVEIKPKNEARSATNPSYVGVGIITEYTPLDGNVGDVHTASLSLVAAGELRRLTDPLAV